MRQRDHEDDSDARRIWPNRDEWRQFGRDMREVARGTYQPSERVREQMEEIRQSERDRDERVNELRPQKTEQRSGVWWRTDEEAER